MEILQNSCYNHTNFEILRRSERGEDRSKMDYMVRVRDILTNNSNELPDFCRKFLEELRQYIETNCIHDWINDNIDVCYGEHCIQIKYCTKCYSTADADTSSS